MAKGGHDAPPTDAPQSPLNNESSRIQPVQESKKKYLTAKQQSTVDRRVLSTEIPKVSKSSAVVPQDDEITAELLAIFGKNLRAFRLRLGMSQSKAAELAGVTQQYLSTIEGGQQNITLKTMAALAKVVDSNVSVLLSQPREPGS